MDFYVVQLCSKSTSSCNTDVPTGATTLVIVPEHSAVMLFSIFILSITISTSPSLNAVPGSTNTLSTLPGSGALIVLEPLPAASAGAAVGVAAGLAVGVVAAAGVGVAVGFAAGRATGADICPSPSIFTC